MTAGLVPFRDALYKEMLGRIKQTGLGVPVRNGKFFYYSRTVEGQQYPLYCRKPMGTDGCYRADAPELLMLDQNEMAKGLKFLGLRAAQVSDDGNLLAYSTDTTGFRQHTLHVKALVTRRAYADTAERVTSVEWANDNQTLFYVVSDQSMVTPASVYDYTLATLDRKLMKQQEVLGGDDPANHVTERQWAPARDGVKIPISLVYKKGVARDGTAPLWLYGYGSSTPWPTFAAGTRWARRGTTNTRGRILRPRISHDLTPPPAGARSCVLR